jgi:hypothetical protein
VNGRLWRVYGDTPPARTYSSKREVRRLMRRYRKLGIRPTLYRSEGDGWVVDLSEDEYAVVCYQDDIEA